MIQAMGAEEIQAGDSAAKLLEKLGGTARARAAQHSAAYHDAAALAQMAAAGWFGAGLEEARGGFDFSPKAVLALHRECGRALAPEPLAAWMGAAHILGGCPGADAGALLSKVIGGDEYCAPVFPGLESANAAHPEFSGGRVNGACGPVFDAHAAAGFIFGAEAGGKFCIFHVRRAAPGLTFSAKPTLDGGTLGSLRFDNVSAADLTTLHDGNAARELMGEALSRMRLGHAGALLGLMERAFEMTLDYLKTRKQFGAPIGSFQALQHRAASLHIAITAARALLFEAAMAVGGENEAWAAAAAKAHLSEAAMRVVREGVQMHGAIGYTDEHDMSLYVRRAICLSAAGGDPAACLKSVAGPMVNP